MQRIYSHAGMELTEKSRQRMASWVADNPMHKAGAFKYSLEEFGLDATRIEQDMADYYDFIKMCFNK